MQQRDQIPSDIWPVRVSMSVFTTSDYLLHEESHVDPSAVYFSVYCNKQGTSMQSTRMLHKMHYKSQILHGTYHK